MDPLGTASGNWSLLIKDGPMNNDMNYADSSEILQDLPEDERISRRIWFREPNILRLFSVVKVTRKIYWRIAYYLHDLTF